MALVLGQQDLLGRKLLIEQFCSYIIICWVNRDSDPMLDPFWTAVSAKMIDKYLLNLPEMAVTVKVPHPLGSWKELYTLDDHRPNVKMVAPPIKWFMEKGGFRPTLLDIADIWTCWNMGRNSLFVLIHWDWLFQFIFGLIRQKILASSSLRLFSIAGISRPSP